jgi:hypothetical protein
MEAMRSEWSDRRLDDSFRQIEQRLGRIESRLDDLQRTMVHGFFALATMFVVGFGTLVTLMLALHH